MMFDKAETACKALNVRPVFASQVDGDTVLSNEKSNELLKLIETLKPDMVFTHWPVDSHRDHQVAGLLALSAWINMKKSYDLYFYEVNTGSETMGFNATDYIDITDHREKKKLAMNAHKTQDPVRTYDSFFRQMEEFRGLEAGVKAAEAFIHFKRNATRASL
ncbi:MAG: PIG-L family deacetylase [Chitinophagaceae bacterium]|nr:PIG-L family deacetylase [Chitinophagaceae bacterium]